MAYLYLQYRHVMSPEGRVDFAKQLRDCYLHMIIEDTSPIYGDGFREALHAYNTYNSLQMILDHIRRTGVFPEGSR
jgi:hypothetical protein